MKHFHLVLTICAVLLFSAVAVQTAHAGADCCIGVRGDFNSDGTDADPTDLAALVDYLFAGGTGPACAEEADLNADGNVADPTDLAFLVDYLFAGGTAPADCPVTDVVVYTDEYGTGVTYQAFGGSKLDAVQTETVEVYAGTSGLAITIPDVGDPSGGYSGGAFTSENLEDLSGYNALTFWAKASKAATLDVAGIGNNNTGTSLLTAEVNGLALTTTWQKYVIPLPDPSLLIAEDGLFYFAEGPEDGLGYTIYIDEIIFENLATLSNVRPAIPVQTIDLEEGETANIGNGSVIIDVDGTDVTLSAMPGYFSFTSTDDLVASIATDGTISGNAAGSADITATMAGIPATGVTTVNVTVPSAGPAGPAPTPTPDQADVVAIYSDAYTPVTTVDTWSAVWDNADVEDFLIGSDNTKKYTNLVFAGIEFTTTTVDASAMTHFHMDVWTPDPTDAPAVFKVKLVDFGPDGVFGNGDDVEHELSFDENTMKTGEWVGIDVPLASFTGLTTRGHLAQMIISGDPNTVYVDNIYFYDAGLPTEPIVAAPTPTEDPAYVVSLYSDVYTDEPVSTFSASWDAADVADFVVESDNVKQYTNLVFAGIEFFTPTPVDASSMTYFHMDVWTPDPTASPAVFKVKLVDLGADGVFGGGDDVEHELSFDETTMSTGSWFSIDVPLTDFTNLVTTGNLAQLIISGDLSTVFVDNVYFYTDPPTEPQSASPVPPHAPGDVISLYSDAYTDVTVDTWSATWDDADVADVVILSDNMKKYTNFVFAGVEFTSSTIDASTMTDFHMDVWTPDPTAAPAIFKVKLVDFGADGAFGGGDDVEHELTFDETTMNTGSWVSIDVPLSDFVNLTTRGHLAQLIMVSTPNTVFVDNIYFYK